MNTKTYDVSWFIQIDAEDANSAAEEARTIMLDPESTATTFCVNGDSIALPLHTKGLRTSTEYQIIHRHGNVVLCSLPGNRATGYVVWKVGISNETYDGFYCKEFHNALRRFADQVESESLRM